MVDASCEVNKVGKEQRAMSRWGRGKQKVESMRGVTTRASVLRVVLNPCRVKFQTCCCSEKAHFASSITIVTASDCGCE
jgi:hypothetical protein